MAFIESLVVFFVGFVSGTVVRWFAGLAAILALVLVVLGVTTPDVALVNQIIEQYYLGNELLFISGFLFGIDVEETKDVVVERRG